MARPPTSRRPTRQWRKAIAEPRRRAILEPSVANEELAAGEIAAAFDVTRTAVSQHLTVLKQAGLLTERRDGTQGCTGPARTGWPGSGNSSTTCGRRPSMPPGGSSRPNAGSAMMTRPRALGEPPPGSGAGGGQRAGLAALWPLVLDRFRDYLQWTSKGTARPARARETPMKATPDGPAVRATALRRPPVRSPPRCAATSGTPSTRSCGASASGGR